MTSPLAALTPNPDRFRSTQDRLNFVILSNARRIASAEYKTAPNWEIARAIFGFNGTAAFAICRNAGIDPMARVVAG